MKGKELIVDSIEESQENVSSHDHSIVTLKISCYKLILAAVLCTDHNGYDHKHTNQY